MDSTAGDLSHAAKELDEKIEQHSTSSSHDVRTFDTKILREDEISGENSSASSSSRDVEKLEKLDSKIVDIGEVKSGEEIYAHLSAEEREIIKRQLDIPPITVTFKTLYRYATRNDLIIVFISAIAAIIGGAVMPLMTVGHLF